LPRTYVCVCVYVRTCVRMITSHHRSSVILSKRNVSILQTSVRYDKTSDKFAFRDARSKVKVIVTICIRPSLDGTYYSMASSVRPFVRPSVRPSVCLSVENCLSGLLTRQPLNVGTSYHIGRYLMGQGCSLLISRSQGQRSRSQEVTL
jgi:hypothetical protein